MKLMLENWNRFVNENEEELDEGLASLAMDPETMKNVGIAIRAISQSAANFSPAMLGAVGAYLVSKYGSGGKPPGDFKFDDDVGSTTDRTQSSKEMTKGMDWPSPRKPKNK